MLFSEPKIPQCEVSHAPRRRQKAFQCSSASRKFLNKSTTSLDWRDLGVSVLFSEPKIPQSSVTSQHPRPVRVSVLFSEPKIPQLRRVRRQRNRLAVSVLFSEPKIPQLRDACAEVPQQRLKFQCSSASRKFLNSHATR